MEKGTKFIVFIDYCEPDMAPNSPGFDSQPRFYHAETMEQARKRIKTEYEKRDSLCQRDRHRYRRRRYL